MKVHPPIMAEGIIDRGGIQARVADIADSNRRDAAINHGQKEKEAEENRYQKESVFGHQIPLSFL